MKKFNKLRSLKSHAIRMAVFTVLSLTANSAFSQTLAQVPGTGFSDDNWHEQADGYYKWKLSGSWFGNGIFVNDGWDSDGISGGTLTIHHINKVGSSTQSYFTNIQETGYGFLAVGNHTVGVDCKERYWVPIFNYWAENGLSGSHNYVVLTPF